MNEGPPGGGPSSQKTQSSVSRRRAVRICDERSREREQTDREHDERAMHARDLVHGVPPLRFWGAPVTLGPASNRPTTSG